MENFQGAQSLEVPANEYGSPDSDDELDLETHSDDGTTRMRAHSDPPHGSHHKKLIKRNSVEVIQIQSIDGKGSKSRIIKQIILVDPPEDLSKDTTNLLEAVNPTLPYSDPPVVPSDYKISKKMGKSNKAKRFVVLSSKPDPSSPDSPTLPKSNPPSPLLEKEQGKSEKKREERRKEDRKSEKRGRKEVKIGEMEEDKIAEESASSEWTDSSAEQSSQSFSDSSSENSLSSDDSIDDSLSRRLFKRKKGKGEVESEGKKEKEKKKDKKSKMRTPEVFKKKRSFSLTISALPKTNKQKLNQRLRRNEPVKSILEGSQLRTVLMKELLKQRKPVLKYLSQQIVLQQLIDLFLCIEINATCGYYCHWASHILSTKAKVVMDALVNKSWIHLDHLFKFFEGDICLNIQYLNEKKLDVDISTLPNHIQYFILIARNLILERGPELLEYLMYRDTHFINQLVPFFQYTTICQFLIEIICLEYRLKTTHPENIFWHEKYSILNCFFEEFYKTPEIHLESLHLLLTSFSAIFKKTQPIMLTMIDKTIPDAILPLLHLLIIPKHTCFVMDIFVILWGIDIIDVPPDLLKGESTGMINVGANWGGVSGWIGKTGRIDGLLVTELVKHPSILLEGLKVGNCGVDYNVLLIVYGLIRDGIVERMEVLVEQILENYWKFPKRNVFHSVVVLLLVFVLKQEDKKYNYLKELIMKRLRRKMNKSFSENQHYYINDFKSIIPAIPACYKDEKWKDLEGKVNVTPPLNPDWEVPERLLKKKMDTKGTLVDTEQAFLQTPTHSNNPTTD